MSLIPGAASGKAGAMAARVEIYRQNQQRGGLNIVMNLLVIIYRHFVFGMDVVVFLLKTIGTLTHFVRFHRTLL
jgi:hypothetical protein